MIDQSIRHPMREDSLCETPEPDHVTPTRKTRQLGQASEPVRERFEKEPASLLARVVLSVCDQLAGRERLSRLILLEIEVKAWMVLKF